ncbi:uncharacterized protein ColSpa_11379 [Colletotrichum spaethianum]|uniref:Uncharacterized protein n=1 Tax=Colletotrichum spaethianum TaxID=700344 RepID=A0AA37UT48_9PEZI|nr:uncharacterized protein ColSpa_11379 [Colletotrichum spaethianum]GKT51198.1 hypothetical protein ColSpa_11379 [Colletotrichum spaethianum]
MAIATTDINEESRICRNVCTLDEPLSNGEVAIIHPLWSTLPVSSHMILEVAIGVVCHHVLEEVAVFADDILHWTFGRVGRD